ncbi:MAG TPA: hypothetical protein VF693_01845 [Allosphingosinicella sp.]|jgi:hypothetical protein
MLSERDTDEAWKQYESLKDLYKFYVGQLVDFHRFYFAVVGGVVVYVLANRDGAVPFALLMPLVISVGGVVTFLFGIRKSRELTMSIRDVAGRLEMLSAHTEVLEFLCWAFLTVHLLILAGSGWLLFRLEPSLNLGG